MKSGCKSMFGVFFRFVVFSSVSSEPSSGVVITLPASVASVVVSAVHRFCFLFPFHGIFYVSLFDCRFFLLLYFAFFYYVSFLFLIVAAFNSN